MNLLCHELIFLNSPPALPPSRMSQQLLGSLPGVDPNDPDIQNALKNAKKDDDDDKKEGDEKK